MAGPCPCCGAQLEGARILIERAPRSSPHGRSEPAREISCSGCQALLAIPESGDSVAVICDPAEVVRTIERLRAASERGALLAELDLLRPSRALEAPEAFALVKHLFTGTAELSFDSVFEIPLRDPPEWVEIAMARLDYERVKDPPPEPVPQLHSHSYWYYRFLAPKGSRFRITSIASTWISLHRPRLPNPRGRGPHGYEVKTLLAPPGLLRPAER
jgi:hypothetical protein